MQISSDLYTSICECTPDTFPIAIVAAEVLKNRFKSTKNSRTCWYEFDGRIWKKSSTESLRHALSKDVAPYFLHRLQNTHENDDEKEQNVIKIINKLNNRYIVYDISDLLYDKKFYETQNIPRKKRKVIYEVIRVSDFSITHSITWQN